MNQQISMKVQLGEKVKMLPKAQYETIDELTKAAKRSYPKRLQDKTISLKYADEEGDWLYLSEDDDLTALGEFATKLDKKKVKLVVEVKKQEQADEVNQAMEDLTLEEKKEVKFEDLKDFKFSDVAEKIEELLNSEEKFGKMKIWKTIKDAAEGTKAEQHFKRLGKGCRGFGRKHKRDKLMRKFFSKSTSNERSGSSSGEDFVHPGYGHPMGPFASPHHFGPHPGFGGHFGPHHRHGPKHNKRARRFFRNWMNTFRNSSSDGTSEDRKEKRRACKEMRRCHKNQGAPAKKLEFKLQEETIVGKAGEKVNFTVGIKDIAPHPIWLTGAKKIEGDQVEFDYQPFDEVRVFREEGHEVELTATLPSVAGEYPVTVGFLNKRQNFIPGRLELNFRAE